MTSAARWLCPALLVACASKDGASHRGACKPLSVTVDGTALAAMPHGLAKANRLDGDVTYEVQVFDHTKTSCEQLLDKTGRPIVDGETTVRVFAGGAGKTGKGVAIGPHTQLGGAVTLASPAPTAPGDVVQICADRVSFTPIAGPHKDKVVVVDGLFAGSYCGEVKW